MRFSPVIKKQGDNIKQKFQLTKKATFKDKKRTFKVSCSMMDQYDRFPFFPLFIHLNMRKVKITKKI